jgi:GNAT superfamily N-acetyltransferase
VVRRALPSERAGVVETVTEAFREDPAWAFLMGERYSELAPAFAGSLFDLRVGAGNVWVADDLAAVAMWRSPAGGEGTDDGTRRQAQELWTRYHALAGDRAFDRLRTYNEAVSRASRDGPHWYLGVLATHPARRREGLATAALGPVLGESDRSGVPCCLETSTEPNRRFYERRGFVEAVDVIVDGGPATWWLCRPARRASR